MLELLVLLWRGRAGNSISQFVARVALMAVYVLEGHTNAAGLEKKEEAPSVSMWLTKAGLCMRDSPLSSSCSTGGETVKGEVQNCAWLQCEGPGKCCANGRGLRHKGMFRVFTKEALRIESSTRAVKAPSFGPMPREDNESPRTLATQEIQVALAIQSEAAGCRPGRG